MCIIVDTCSGIDVFSNAPSDEMLLVRDALFGSSGITTKLIIGGHLSSEYMQSGALKRALTVLDRAGRVRRADNEQVDNETESIRDQCRSNDAHVVALARVSGARVIVTLDEQLRKDMKDKKLIDNPRGKILSKAAHARLLRDACP